MNGAVDGWLVWALTFVWVYEDRFRSGGTFPTQVPVARLVVERRTQGCICLFAQCEVPSGNGNHAHVGVIAALACYRICTLSVALTDCCNTSAVTKYSAHSPTLLMDGRAAATVLRLSMVESKVKPA